MNFSGTTKKRGPQPKPPRAELKQLALVTRERDKLRQQLTNARLVIEVQKKVAGLLEQIEVSSKSEKP
jgi:transposase